MKPILALALAAGLTLAAPAGAEIYGTYSNGCIRGAVELPRKSPLYQVQYWGAARNFGHRDLVAFIQDLAQRAHEAGIPRILVGDLSKTYGGPFGSKSAHGSHQIGLDVDVSFDYAEPLKSSAELRNPRDVLLVKNGKLTRDFTPDRISLMRLAALDPRVERIFVAPQIKLGICEATASEAGRASWLRKIRPWYGHRGHMHIRIACPKDSPGCKPQAAPPAGDGCGAELMSWFEPPKPQPANQKPKPKPKKVLPPECELILKGK
ncbi:MAG: penicillin-insensitive murein endopeptidase [Succinivibrionaceae bacterium]|nr:penicillin-insensitive murein endopeptidase [Succinivibrionaceae bacterium]